MDSLALKRVYSSVEDNKYVQYTIGQMVVKYYKEKQGREGK